MLASIACLFLFSLRSSWILVWYLFIKTWYYIMKLWILFKLSLSAAFFFWHHFSRGWGGYSLVLPDGDRRQGFLLLLGEGGSSWLGGVGVAHYCSPHGLHWHPRVREGLHYWLIGEKVPAPYMAFPDTILKRGLGASSQPGKDGHLGLHLAFAAGRGGVDSVFLWYLARILVTN